jgi:hypothetical protein
MTTIAARALEDFPDTMSARPIWLITLADLALLLVGFFVLLQANQSTDRKAMANGFRRGFGGATLSQATNPPMPVAAAAVTGFAPGSSVLPRDPGNVIVWARDIAHDPRTVLTVIGSVDGSPADVDPQTGSATVLAVDRARAVAAALAVAVPTARLSIASAADGPGQGRRSVLVSLGFAGERTLSADSPATAAAIPAAATMAGNAP